MNLADKQYNSTTDSTLLVSNNSTGSPTAEVGNNVFSKANVFGLFLVLALCLLAQPYGSVLYMRPSGILGRTLFFFWRLNPLACAAEAFLIVFLFFSGTSRRWLDDNDEQYAPMTFRKKLHLIADAVLFLRAYSNLPEHWAALADRRRWEAGRVIETQPPRTVLVDENVPGPVLLDSSTDIVDERRLGYEREAPIENGPPPRNPHASSASRPSTTTAPPSLAAAQPSSSQSEGRIENGHETGLEAEAAAAIRALRSGQVVICGLRLTTERLIHIVSAISVIAVIIKIAATQIPPYIHVAAWFMISGWAAVEILIALSHRDHDEAAHEATLVRCGFLLQSRLHGSLIWTSLFLLCLPILLYLSHVAFYKTDDLAKNTHWRSLARMWIMAFFFWGIYWYYAIKNAIHGPPSCRRPSRRRRARIVPSSEPIEAHSPVMILIRRYGAPKIPSAVVACGKLISAILPYSIGFGYVHLEGVLDECAVDPSSPTCNVLLTTSTTFWLSVGFFVPAVVFSSSQVSPQGVRHRYMNVFQGACLIWNLSLTTLCFVIAMMLYRPETTYKPDWLDWLGKMHRWARGTNTT